MRSVTKIVALSMLLLAGCGGGENAPSGSTTAAPASTGSSQATSAKPAATTASATSAAPAGAQSLTALVTAVDACPKDGDCNPRQDLFDAARKATKDELVAALPSAKTPKSQQPIVEGLGRVMEDSLIPTIEPFITSTDFSLKRAAHQAISAKGNEPGLTKLALLLDSHADSDTVHSDVPEILAKYPQSAASKAALPKLKKMAAEDAQGVGRMEACKAVVAIEGEAAVPFLVERVEKETWDSARAGITVELAKFAKVPKAQAALKKLASDKDAFVQKTAKKALGE